MADFVFKPNTLIFLSKGFFTHDDVLALVDEFADAGCSETELSDRLAELSQAVDNAYLAHKYVFDQAYKEIFSYDISEPMGSFIAEHATTHNELPTAKQVYDEALRRIVRRCDPGKLHAAVNNEIFLFSEHSPEFKSGVF